MLLLSDLLVEYIIMDILHILETRRRVFHVVPELIFGHGIEAIREDFCDLLRANPLLVHLFYEGVPEAPDVSFQIPREVRLIHAHLLCNITLGLSFREK